MEYFCGLGVITSDTPIWQHSRKLLRPTFDKSNKSDLTTLSIQVESLMVKLPVEGSSVDLQPLIFLTVSFRDWGPG
jgi:cytochrome P450